MAEQVLKIVIENEEAVSALKETQTANKEFTDEFVKTADQRDAALKKMQAELEATARAQQKTANPEVLKSLQAYERQIKGNIEALKKASAASKVQAGATAQVGEATESIRTKMRKLQRTLGDMALAGKENTKEYNQMVMALGKMKDAYGDVQARAKFFQDDIRWITATTQAVQGLIGAYSIYAGVASMVAGEDEDLQKQMMKMQRLMTIMIGLTQVANTLNKDSMVVTGAKVLYEKAAAMWMKVTNSLLKINTIETERATVAQKALNKAKLGVWGIVAALIIAATTVLVKYIIKQNELTEADKEGIRQMERKKELMIENNKRMSEASDNIKTYIENLKKQGIAEHDLVVQQLADLEADKIAAASKKGRTDDLTNSIKELTDQQSDLQKEMDKLKPTDKNYIYNLDLKQRKISDLQTEVDALTKELDELKTEEQKHTDIIKENTKETYNQITAAEAAAKAREEQARSLENYLKLLEKLKDDAANIELGNLTGIDRIEAEGKLQLAAIQKFSDELLAEKKKAYGREAVLSEQEIALIGVLENAARNKQNEALKKYLADREKIIADSIDKIQQLDLERFKKEQEFASQEFSVSQKNQANEFNMIRHTEEEKNKFQQDQAKARLQFQIEQGELLLQYYKDLSAATGKTFDDEIRAITISLGNLRAEIGAFSALPASEGGFSLAKLLGMTDEEIETLNQAVSAFDQATDMILDTLAKRYAAETQYYANIAQARANDLQNAEQRLNQEIELAKLGYASNVDLAKKQVAELKTQRDKALADQAEAQRREQTIQSLQQASNLVTAVTNIFTTYSEIPYVGVILALVAAAAMIADFATLKTQAKAATATLEKGGSGVVRGKRHSAGGEDFDDHIEVEDGEGWSVYNRKATNKYGSAIPELTSALNQGRPLDAIAALSRFVPAQMNQIPLKEINEAKRQRVNEYEVMESRLGNIEGEVAELNGYFRNKEEIIEQGTNFTKYRKGNSIKIVRRNG